MMEAFFGMAIADVTKDAKAKHLAPILERLSKNFKCSFLKAIKGDSRFLIHGDFWSNNVMYDDNDTECRIYDWQFFAANSPFLDVIILMFTRYTKLGMYSSLKFNLLQAQNQAKTDPFRARKSLNLSSSLA